MQQARLLARKPVDNRIATEFQQKLAGHRRATLFAARGIVAPARPRIYHACSHTSAVAAVVLIALLSVTAPEIGPEIANVRALRRHPGMVV